MKRICFLFNHFQFQDGVCRSAIAMANLLAECAGVEITLMSIYRFEKQTKHYLNPKVRTVSIFGFYFRGFSKFVEKTPCSLLYKRYLKGSFDIEIAFQYGTSYKILNSVDKSPEVRRVGWIHGYDMTFKQYYLKMNQMVSVSKEGAIRAHHDLNGNVPVSYCYNPIDNDYVVIRGTESIPINRISKGIQLVTVGRLSPEKGYDRLIRIAKKLKDDGYSFSLWIIGNGPEKEKLSSLIEKSKLNETVYLLGAKTNPHAYTSKSDVFICSSFSEGYSTACTEAIMLGIPVITTKVGGAKEIIEDSECGILTEKDDEALYHGIKQALDNPALIAEWKETLKSTKKRFSANERFQQLKNILQLD